MENQSNQTIASLGKVSSVAGGLAKVLIGVGIAGVAAMTTLAVKSPVLAGTMAKIELATLKLSNTIGRQLRPVFENIAQNLLPAINKAFGDNAEGMGFLVDKTNLLVNALTNLIELDLTGAAKDIANIFIGLPKGVTQEELQETAKAKLEERQEDFRTRIEEQGGPSVFGEFGNLFGDVRNLSSAIISFFEKMAKGTSEKEFTFANVNWVVR